MSNEKKIRFPVKRSGLGWGPPCTWQGWVVLIVYIILFVTAPRLLPPKEMPSLYAGYLALLITTLIGFGIWKGGRSGSGKAD